MEQRVVSVVRLGVAVMVSLAATLVGVLVLPEAGVDAAAARLTPMNPARLADTRAGEKTVDGKYAGTGRIAGGAEFAVVVAGRAGVPADAAAVMMNVTAVRPDGPGHVTVYPCGTKRPNVSNINYEGNDVAPNAVLSKVGSKGRVCVFSLRGTDLIVDVNAFVPVGGTPVPLNPVRNVDTRDAAVIGNAGNPGRLSAGKEYKFTIAGTSGVPTKAVAAMMNVTAVRPDGPGFVTVYPCGTKRPIVSNINYEGKDVAPNAVLSKLGTAGQVCIYSLRSTDLIIDVNAFVPAGGSPVPIDPVRYADTRPGQLTVDGTDQGTGRLAGGKEHRFTIAGRTGVPKNASAAMMNITAVRPDGPGHVTVYPCGTKRPNVSSINYRGNDVAPNAVLSKLGTNGQVCVFSLATTDLIIDVNGFVVNAQVDPPTYSCVINGKKVVTFIPPQQCDALIDVYNSTDGPNWIQRDRWNTPTDPCTWYGVDCYDGNVASLSLDQNGLTGKIPTTIGNFTGLMTLSLDNNRLRGRIPSSIGKLTLLTSVGMSHNRLSGAIPRSLGNLKNLEYLRLAHNQLSGSIPSSVGRLGKLQLLDLSFNQITGELPSSIGRMTSLRDVNLSDNQITGNLPTTIGGLSSLVFFNLDSNQLTGEIPQEIGQLTKLEVLYLSTNRLTGSIPTTFGDLTSLWFVTFKDNQLTGEIPAEIGNLVKLEVLALDSNQLSGSIPSAIDRLVKLDVLLLGSNLLEGPVPPTIMQLNLENLLLLGNRCLTAADPALAAWLSKYDPSWNDGCQ